MFAGHLENVMSFKLEIVYATSAKPATRRNTFRNRFADTPQEVAHGYDPLRPRDTTTPVDLDSNGFATVVMDGTVGKWDGKSETAARIASLKVKTPKSKQVKQAVKWFCRLRGSVESLLWQPSLQGLLA
ncbi:hypothetical protein J6590_078583 [Homalodisca vitripennis]|nr:hypothetical protein J6590_078583 [Homalodisca vitripennis]